ncbi:uncharacterized protein LOC129925193 isoform X2 [Biomphalaria glabrata]|uniref:Uncharacterized protein LOC129925193 isoform X2 n=1 Tax=Biomphalaria glabrata TaxID=6526 RepID=A0A9W2ZYQ1_BIOGL|nr:uncharacterized protein LOC129925193 isoform X2 [Biomphalaria glabrata]
MKRNNNTNLSYPGGVFQGCSDLTGCTSARGDTNDWQKASAALEVVAELLCLCDIVTLFAAMFKVKSSHTWKYVKIASSMLTLAAALSMVVPLALYGTNANKMYPGVILNVGWAYVLVCVSAIMQSLSGVTLIIELLV